MSGREASILILVYAPASRMCNPEHLVKDGTVRPNDSSTARDAEPQPAGNEFLGAVFQQATSAFAVLNLDLNFVAVNAHYCHLVGRTADQLVGRSMFEVFPDDPADATKHGSTSLRRSLQRVVDDGETDSMELLRYDIENVGQPGTYHEKYWGVTNSALRLGASDEVTHVLNHPTEVTTFIDERLRRQTSGDRPVNTVEVADAINTVFTGDVERLESLNVVVQSLVACDTVAHVARTTLRDGIVAVDAVAAMFLAVKGEHFTTIDTTGPIVGGDAMWRYEPDPNRWDPFSEAITKREPIMISTRAALVDGYRGQQQSFLVDHEAWAILPLVIGDEAIGAIALAYDVAEPFSPELRLRLYTLASLAAQATSRAVLIAEQGIEIDSVHRALTTHLDQIDGVDTSDLYRPASRRTRSGGDWYDVIELDDQHTLIVIGDVANHGPTATGEMARARSAIHAYALEHRSPQHIITLTAQALDKLAQTHSTVIVGVYELDTAEFTWTNAGHPYPIIVRADGSVDVLDTTHGPPLGSHLTHAYTDSTVRIDAGDSLIVYTDGLIEHSDETFDASLQRLVTAAGASGAMQLDIARHLFETLVPTGIHEDDVAVLTLTRHRTDHGDGSSAASERT